VTPPSSLFPPVWGPAPVAAALWLAAPILALLVYGWGMLLALPFAAWVVWESRSPRRARVGPIALLLVGFSWPALADPDLSVDAARFWHWWPLAWISLLLLVTGLQATITRLGARELRDDPAERGDPRARARRVSEFFGVSTTLGALGAVLSDEPLLPVTLAYIALSAVLWTHATRRALAAESRAAALFDGRDPAFEVIGDAEQGALVFSRADGVPFRAPDAADACAILEPAPRGLSIAQRNVRLGIVAAALACAAVLSHADVSESVRAYSRRPRLWVVQRPVPSAIRSEFPHHRSFTRLQEPTIPGASVWQNCVWPVCGGAVVVVDDTSRQILEAPAAMRRVRDRTPLHLARTRLALTRLYADREVGEVITCGEVLILRSEQPLALDLARGDIVELRDRSAGCDAAGRALATSAR
jgi:hypothetical protein